MAFVSTLLVSPDPAADPTELAQYYVTEAVPEGGGTNVVNVVPVDFRGFDTMGNSSWSPSRPSRSWYS